MKDSDMVKCRYVKLGKGHHLVVGPATGKAYGYRGQGDIFLVHKRDVQAGMNWFQPIQDERPELVVRMPAVQAKVAPPPPEIVVPMQLDDKGGGQPDYDDFVRGVIEGREAPPEAVSAKEPEAEAEVSEAATEQQQEAVAAVIQGEEQPVTELAPPAKFELQLVPGLTSEIAEQLQADGVVSAEDIVAQGVDGLQKYRGVGAFKASVILQAAQDWLDAAG